MLIQRIKTNHSEYENFGFSHCLPQLPGCYWCIQGSFSSFVQVVPLCWEAYLQSEAKTHCVISISDVSCRRCFKNFNFFLVKWRERKRHLWITFRLPAKQQNSFVQPSSGGLSWMCWLADNSKAIVKGYSFLSTLFTIKSKANSPLVK